MLGIRVPDPDEAMLISGGKGGHDGAPFRVVVGNRKFVMPFINRVSYLTLAMQEAQVAEKCVTAQGIEIIAKAVCAFKVATDEQSIINAGQRFLSDQEQMPNLVGQIFAGHLRSIIDSMTVGLSLRERARLIGLRLSLGDLSLRLRLGDGARAIGVRLGLVDLGLVSGPCDRRVPFVLGLLTQ
ncbi:MAG TPA: flotillin family protein [Solirubrobacteraceae bacterium]|nr:flotillin family protein [Solirubrobacteraceae bacterium]